MSGPSSALSSSPNEQGTTMENCLPDVEGHANLESPSSINKGIYTPCYQARRLTNNVQSLASGSFSSSQAFVGNHSYRSLWAKLISNVVGRLTTPKLFHLEQQTFREVEARFCPLQFKSLISGHIAGDSTVRISSCDCDCATNLSIYALTEAYESVLASQQNRTKDLKVTKSKRISERSTGPISSFKSLGCFDFPRIDKKKPANMESQLSSDVPEKGGCLFDFPLFLMRRQANISPKKTTTTQVNIDTYRCTHPNTSRKSVQLQFWQDMLDQRTNLYGSGHPRTMKTKIQLGNVYLKYADYSMAVETFRSILHPLPIVGAQESWQQKHRLMVACILEKLSTTSRFPTSDKVSEGGVLDSIPAARRPPCGYRRSSQRHGLSV